MGFTSHFETTCRWRALPDGGATAGIEHCSVIAVENNIIITSVVIGGTSENPFGINYKIICSPDWAVRSFEIENTNGCSLCMNSDGDGNWFYEDFSEAPQFSGAIDVDFSGTPVTNTLPVRRMRAHAPGRSQRFKMLYVPFGTLKPKIANQQYTCIAPYKKYRYESRGSDFSTVLEFDGNGIVTDYPDAFVRENLEI